MKIVLILVGKTTNSHLASLCKDYEARIARYAPFIVQVVPDLKNAKSLSQEQQRQRESEGILKLLQPADHVVLLDEHGCEMRSVEYARWLSAKMLSSPHRLVFIVGGPYGFSQRVRNMAAEQISLSRLTFSHQMVRLFFLEQLYRAFSIINGEPYHHE